MSASLRGSGRMGSELAVQETALRDGAELGRCIRKSNKFTELTATDKTILQASRPAGRRVAGDFLFDSGTKAVALLACLLSE